MDSQTPNQAPQIPNQAPDQTTVKISNETMQQFNNLPPPQAVPPSPIPQQPIPPPPPPTLQGSTFKGIAKPFLYITLSIILLVSIFALSFFYFANQRQPQLQSRAALPTQAINLKLSPTSSQPIPTQIPTLSDSQPTSPVVTPVPSEAKVSSPQEAQRDATRAIFDVSAENNVFTPKHLTAYVDQIVVIYFNAKDHNYDVAIPNLNLKKTIKQNQKSALEFQAQNFGEFVFECKENCDNSPEARGLLIIKPTPL